MSKMKDKWYDEWWEKYAVDRPRWHTDENPNREQGRSSETDCWCWPEGSGGEIIDVRHLGADSRSPVPSELEDMLDNLRFSVMRIHDELSDLLVKKHADYGPSNILNSPGGPLNGISVRLYDKIARLNNLLDNNVSPRNESLRDTLVDIANYASIGLLVIDGDWGK